MRASEFQYHILVHLPKPKPRNVHKAEWQRRREKEREIEREGPRKCVQDDKHVFYCAALVCNPGKVKERFLISQKFGIFQAVSPTL